MARSHTKARFTDPMLLLRTDRLPEGATWQYEIKLDGYRAIAFKSGGRVQLRSRNDKEFGGKYPAIVKALAAMPDETVIESRAALGRWGAAHRALLSGERPIRSPSCFHKSALSGP